MPGNKNTYIKTHTYICIKDTPYITKHRQDLPKDLAGP